jgi:protein-S-isoprenylcysteine O-methyltransferase Ste14
MLRIAFWFLFWGMVFMQTYFALGFRRSGEWVTAFRMDVDFEGWGYNLIRLIRSIALITFLVLYAINPPWMETLTMPLPTWLRWAGVALGVISLVLYAWSRATLGRAWSSHLQTREKHQLVTTGPYAKIRHPIYLSILIFWVSLALVTANLFFFVFLVISGIDLGLRIPKEEQMLTKTFGEDYKAYVQRTGRLFPNIKRPK